MDLYKNTEKPRINLSETREVIELVLAADPTTEAELDTALQTARVVGKAKGKCYRDETPWVRPRLFAALILPRLCAGSMTLSR